MKLDQMVTNVLQSANILNRTLVLENQNQGNELGEIADLEKRFEVDLLSDEMQPHKNRHAKHRNELDSQQSSKPLDTMPDDDLRHPYSAHKPKQKHVEPPLYRKNFEESRSAQKEISNSIERTKEIFYHLKEREITEYDRERKYTQTNLQDTQSLYKDFRHLKDRLLDNESFMQEQREAIHVFLEENPASNRHEHLRKYLEMYNTEINNLSLDKLKIDSLIDDCEKMVNEVKEAINNMESRSVNAFTTESPTISPQEKNILTRSKGLSTQFNKLTQEINHLRGQVEELESDMFWENQFPGHESPNRMKDIKAKLTHIRNDQLPKLEGERTFVQSEIMKEKHYIESLVREEKMSPSKAIEYRKEYEKLIHRFEELDNERNKREKLGKPSLSENTLTTATTTERPTTAINVATPEKTTLAINTTTSTQADDPRHPYSAYSPATPASTDALNHTEVFDEFKSFFSKITIDDSSNAARPKSTEVLNRTEVLDDLKSFFSNITIDDSGNAARTVRDASPEKLEENPSPRILRNALGKKIENPRKLDDNKRKKRDLSSFSEKLESIATNTKHQVKSKKFLYTQQLGSR